MLNRCVMMLAAVLGCTGVLTTGGTAASAEPAAAPKATERLLTKGTGTATNSGLTCEQVQTVAEPVPFVSSLRWLCG